MSSKLCCTAEQRSGTGSPDLPNARTPALGRRDLRYEHLGSGSAVSSTRAEDQQALQRLFEDALCLSDDDSTLRRPASDHGSNGKNSKLPIAVKKLRKRLSKVSSR